LCSRFGARAALFVPGGQSACRPWTVRVESAGSVFFVFVTCSCAPFFRSIFPAIFSCREFGGRSTWGPRTVREECVGRGRSEVPPQTVRYCWCSTGGLQVFSDSPPIPRGRSAVGSRTVRLVLRRLLSPLLLDLCFRFGIVWSLFLGLVGPL
jgi:hypothetical protein